MMFPIAAAAPIGDEVADYDRYHLALYAELLDAHDAGGRWEVAARDILGLDVADPDAHACWLSHLHRARWIVGDGLEVAITAFGRRDEHLA